MARPRKEIKYMSCDKFSKTGVLRVDYRIGDENCVKKFSWHPIHQTHDQAYAKAEAFIAERKAKEARLEAHKEKKPRKPREIKRSPRLIEKLAAKSLDQSDSNDDQKKVSVKRKKKAADKNDMVDKSIVNKTQPNLKYCKVVASNVVTDDYRINGGANLAVISMKKADGSWFQVRVRLNRDHLSSMETFRPEEIDKGDRMMYINKLERVGKNQTEIAEILGIRQGVISTMLRRSKLEDECGRIIEEVGGLIYGDSESIQSII